MDALDTNTLDHLARLSGLRLAPGELEALRPLITRAADLLERLEALPLAAIEPATQYRVL
jgi:Asp-tRNA(Asn)/Glu-tRNA(Gln) amidotransferase C subunit